MLELKSVAGGYGRATMLDGVDLTVKPGEIVALIGANGAGKSTLMKTVSGLVALRGGEIRFDGARIDRLSSARRVALGIAHVPEGRQIFAGLSVEQNLRLGAYAAKGGVSAERLRDICAPFPVLLERIGEPAVNLSGGQQQMLAICRGLMGAPRLLMLDEPSLGLSPLLVGDIFRMIAALRAQNLAILLSEQNARQSLAIADRGYVIETGRIALAGPAADLLANPELAEKYFGVGVSAKAGASAGQADRLKVILAL